MLNLLFLPFAYFAAIMTKYKLLEKRQAVRMETGSARFDLFSFIVIGPIYLILGIFRDTWIFAKHLFVTYQPKVGSEMLYINMELFVKIEDIL